MRWRHTSSSEVTARVPHGLYRVVKERGGQGDVFEMLYWEPEGRTPGQLGAYPTLAQAQKVAAEHYKYAGREYPRRYGSRATRTYGTRSRVTR